MAASDRKSDSKLHQLHLLSTELNNLRLNQQLVDVILIDNERNEYPANKNVLAASSIYFFKNFVQPKQSVNGPILDKLQLPVGVTAKAVDVILNFCYTGEIDVSENDTELIQDLITSCELLQLETISQYCSELALSELSAENCLLHWQFAEKCDNHEMKREIVKLMSKNFVEIQNSDVFLDANVNCIEMMLNQDEFENQSQDDIFEALLKWLKKDVDSRLDSIPIVLKQNLFEKISDDFLNSLDEREPDLIDKSKYFMMRTLKEASYRLKNPGCRQKIANAEKKTEAIVTTNPNFVPTSTPGKMIETASNCIKPSYTPRPEYKPESKHEPQILFNNVPVSQPPLLPHPPLMNGYVPYQIVNPPLNQLMHAVDRQYFDKQNPRPNNRNFGMPRWSSNDDIHQGAKPKYYNKNKPNWKQNQRDFQSPSSKSDTSQSFNANNQVRPQTSRNSSPSSQTSRNKYDKLQPRRNSEEFLPKKHEFQATKNGSEDTQPAKNHYQPKYYQPYKKKYENIQPNKNATQNQIQTPKPSENQTTKPGAGKIEPVTNCDTQKPQVSANESNKNQTTKKAMETIEKLNMQRESAKIQPVKTEVPATESNGSQTVNKKPVGIFEKFKTKDETTVQSIFTGKPTEVNNSSNLSNESSAEIVIMKSLDENTQIIILDSDGNEKAIEETEIKLPEDAAICANGSTIYILGGRSDSGDVYSTFFTFNLVTRNWGMLTDLNEGRYKAGTIAIGDLVYIIGGRGEDDRSLNRVECYDNGTKEWRDENPLKTARISPALCRYKDSIYAYGGDPEAAKTNTSSGLFASCEIYNLKTNQWNCLQTKLPIQYSLHHAFLTAVMKGKIFAVTALQDEEKWLLHQYDPRINLWQDLLIMNEKMQSWISFGAFNDEQLCFVDAKGGVFMFNLKDEPVRIRNGIGDGENISYAVVLS